MSWRTSYEDFTYHATSWPCKCGQAKLYRIGDTKALACLKCGANAMLVPTS